MGIRPGGGGNGSTTVYPRCSGGAKQHDCCLLCSSSDRTGLGAVAGTAAGKWIALDETALSFDEKPALEPYRIGVYLQGRGRMQGSGIQSIEIVLLLLLLFVAGFTALARLLQTPYPIVLVLAGLALSLVPGIPRVTLNPDLIFLVVLPPLLFSAAWLTSWRDFVHNLVGISSLAFGLVGFTVLGVAGAAHVAFPGFDWRLGVVLGAVIATTDAIAAASIAKRVGLPQRVVEVLEGESLLNDATGLLALEFGLAIVVAGQTPTVTSGFLRLAYLTAAGIAVGLLIGALIHWVEHHIDDGPIEITISLMVPYAAYLAAEFIHASGVLAVVACGLYLGRGS